MTIDGDHAGEPVNEQIRLLLREDEPRWHLVAAEDAIDDGRLDTARGALARALEMIGPGSPDADEAAFVGLRLAMASVDYRGAAGEVSSLAGRCDPADPVWNRRVRALVESAPRVFPGAMRAGLLGLLPEVPDEGVASHGAAPRAAPSLADLPDDEGWEPARAPDPPPERELPPIPTESPFDRARAVRASGGPPPTAEVELVVTVDEPPAETDVVVLVDETLGDSDTAPGFSGRLRVSESDADLTDADALRDHLVEEMLAGISGEEGELLFQTATTFLNNRDFATAEVMFSAAMQVPEFRLGACEGVMQSLIGAGRFAEAVATGARAVRIFARSVDELTGIVYLQGVAAQELGDLETARACYERVAASPDASHIPDLAERRAAVR